MSHEIKNKEIFCFCNNIKVKKVEEHLVEFPNIPTLTIFNSLNVGTRCGQCVYEFSKKLD